MQMRVAFKALVVGLAFVGGAAQALAAHYQFQQLTGPAGGWDVTAINDSKLIVGSAADRDDYAIQAGTWASGSLSLLERNASSSRAWAVSAQGQIAGEVWTNNTGRTAVVWSKGTQTVLARSADTTSQYATGINDASLVVGNRSLDDGRTSQAVTWQNYDVTALDMRGANSSYATGVNNSGQISGYLEYASGNTTVTQAVLWNGDQATTLLNPTDNACCSWAHAVNDNGVVVGDVLTNDGVYRPVYWQGSAVANVLAAPSGGGMVLGVNNLGQAVGTGSIGPWGAALLWDLGTGQYIDLNTYLSADLVQAGWVLTRAVDINSAGDIVGMAYNKKVASFSPFALMAVPEPSTWAMMLLGLTAIGLQRKRAASRRLR